jgi:hypothetical protein
MKRLIQTLRLNEISTHQLLIIGIAILLVEVFLKLGSFTLECLCFLAIYFLLDRLSKLP